MIEDIPHILFKYTTIIVYKNHFQFTIRIQFYRKLITTHPPYAHIIPYTHEKIKCELSKVHSINEFADEMRPMAAECIRVLKPGRHCAILMVDARKHAHSIPITLRVLQAFIQLHALNKYFWVKPDAKSFRDSTRYKCYS